MTKRHKKVKIWRKAILQSVGIASLAIAAGLGVNEIRSDRLPLIGDWSPEGRLAKNMAITLDEARRFCESRSAVFVDARSSDDYREGHILCARNLPVKDVDEHFDSAMAGINLEETIIVYCDGEECSLSEELAKELFFRGYENVKVLVNGWSRWVEAGLPTEKG